MSNDFATFIRQRRQALGKTQAEIGRGCGLSEQSITLLEGGRRRIRLDRVPSLAAVLLVEPAQLCLLALANHAPVLTAVLVRGTAATYEA